jgi:hypothetical protein
MLKELEDPKLYWWILRWGYGFDVFPLEASYNGLRTIDVDKLKFQRSWITDAAAYTSWEKKRFFKLAKGIQIQQFGLKICLFI